MRSIRICIIGVQYSQITIYGDLLRLKMPFSYTEVTLVTVTHLG